MDYQTVLDFWFEKPLDYNKWFYSKSHDKYIKNKFLKLHQEAEKGHLLEWLIEKDSYLAMIILLDQFSRHIFRKTKDAYRNDEKILLFTTMGLEHLEKMSAQEKIFVLLPFQHSENLNDQIFGLRLLKNLIKLEKDVKEKNILKKLLFHQEKHYKVIEKFGRFPKRNIYLNRESTEEEIDYIDENPEYDY